MKTAIDLFCGSGAVTWGLKSAGFHVVGAIDFDPVACATYRANHPEVDLIEKDIREVAPSQFADNLRGGGPIDLLAVCAPCQPFSNRNPNRSAKDSRIKLILEALRFVEELQPEIVFFENVPGLKKEAVFKRLSIGLKRMGYHFDEPRKLDASDLGVPQRRQRMVLIGTRDSNLLPNTKAISFTPKQTVYNAIGNLPIPPVGPQNAEDPLHYARAHTAITLERLRYIPRDGGSRDALPEQLQLSCHKGRSNSSFPDSYGRLKWQSVAPTLTTGCTDLTKGRYAHPEQDRAITLREAARLQSFPDGYIFKGNASQVATQIGNAVPPKMMAGIARTLHAALTHNPYGN